MYRPSSHDVRPTPALLRTIMLWMANTVDDDALTLWLRRFVDLHLIESATGAVDRLSRGDGQSAALLIVDPLAARDAIDRSLDALRVQVVRHVLVLDRRPHEARLAQLLQATAVSYVSRAAGSQALAMAIEDILFEGGRAFDPAVQGRIRRQGSRYCLDGCEERRSIALLSRREREVMQLLAEGHSVRQ